MDKKTEALKLALEALEDISSHYMSLPKKGCMALAAIEEALAQPEQEPVIDKSAAIRIATALGWAPRKQWQGLTDEEFLDIARTFGAQPWPPGSCVAFGQMVEAKLREKNA